jgi:hypothetical protein
MKYMEAVTSNNQAAIGQIANIPMFASLISAYRKQRGDADIPTAAALQHVLATEMAKAVRGAGAVTIPEVESGTEALSTSHNMNQVRGVLQSWSNAMLGRYHTLSDKARAGREGRADR